MMGLPAPVLIEQSPFPKVTVGDGGLAKQLILQKDPGP